MRLNQMGSGKFVALRLLPLTLCVVMAASFAFAATTGSISGTVQDERGAVLQSTTVTLKNTLTGEVRTIQTDDAGFYSFPSVPIGTYEVTFEKTGFDKYQESNVIIDVDTQRRVDATLKIGNVQQQVTVTAAQAQVDTESPQMGEVIGSSQINDIPLNGRSYTDLLALQPGVVPINMSMYSTVAPSNQFNDGLLSISGAQDVHSGFMVNGANTVDGAGEGTFLLPTSDSIAEFRIVTNNAGAEYGGYAGGMVNVVTKSGTNQFHGDAFEFYQGTWMAASDFFFGPPGTARQNQFGGTIGGPILRNKLFFFGDYQGTRQASNGGSDTVVPSAADKQGNEADRAANFVNNPSSVSSSYFAGLLTQRLGYTVTAGEPYYFAANEPLPSGTGTYSHTCASTSECVFPTLAVPQKAWSPVTKNYLKYLPDPSPVSTLNPDGTRFLSQTEVNTKNDDKGAIRIDGDTRVGRVSGYYHYNPWSTPQTPTFGGAVPGFPNDTQGDAQLAVLSLTSTFGSTAVNVFTASYTRNVNITGLTSGGGVTLASLGFNSVANGGPFQESTSNYQNVPQIGSNSFTIGAPVSVVSQVNNTYEGADDFSKIFGTHSLKFGGIYYWEQVDLTHPNNGSNGYFGFNGEETGDDWTDILLGAPSSFNQGSPAGLNLRSFYAGAYAEDSWRMSRDLTLDYGVRWEVNPFWREEHNLNPVELLGVQSTTFPTAPQGYAFPGDAGIPIHMSNINYGNFAPRVGLSYAPYVRNNPLLHTLLGDQGKSSVRVGYGLYYTNIEGYNTFNFASPPYNEFYGAPAPPLFEAPFIDRASGNVRSNPFPLNPLADPKAVNWSVFEPLSARRNPLENSPSPYEEHLDVAFERALTSNTILTTAYVGTFGHHLTVMANANPGNPALCLSVSQASEVTDGNTCGPGGENRVYHPVGGGVINGTRQGFGPLFQSVGWELNVGNSNYHSLQASLRHTANRLSLLFSYTFSKAIDNGSGRGDIVFLNGNRNYFRGLSDYDIRQIFAAAYTVELPFDKFIHLNERIVRGWKITGATKLSGGTPVWIMEPDDRSLAGNTRVSPWGSSTDEPVYTSGNIVGDHNPRHGNSWFNVNLFSREPLGVQGNSPKRFFHGPGVENTDLGFLKDVKIKEGMTAEFRGEFFNAFNHAQFYGNGSVDGNFQDLYSGGFGYVQFDNGGRTGQLGVKFNF